MEIFFVFLASWIISMTCASAQLYLRDIEIIRDMPVCGNRSDVRNWKVRLHEQSIELFVFFLLPRLMFIFSLSHCIWFH